MTYDQLKFWKGAIYANSLLISVCPKGYLWFFSFTNKKPSALPRAFHCSEMCKKSKSPPFLYYEACDASWWAVRGGRWAWVKQHRRGLIYDQLEILKGAKAWWKSASQQFPKISKTMHLFSQRIVSTNCFQEDGFSTPSPSTPPPPVLDLTIWSDDLPTPTKYSPLQSPTLLSPTTRETSNHELTHLVDQLEDQKISEEERSSCLARLLSLKVGSSF